MWVPLCPEPSVETVLRRCYRLRDNALKNTREAPPSGGASPPSGTRNCVLRVKRFLGAHAYDEAAQIANVMMLMLTKGSLFATSTVHDVVDDG